MAGAYLAEQARQQAADALEDPIEYFIRLSRKVGVVLAVVGTGMGIAAYYLTAAATAAMNNETAVLGNIATIFSNIQAPSFTPAPIGTAPVTASVAGVQNFFGNAWSDVQAGGADLAGIGGVMGTLGEDVAAGLVDMAKAALAFVMHFPDILWNGLVWGVGGAAAAMLTWAFPWLLIIAGFLLAASMIAQGLRALWRSTVGAAWSASYAQWSERLQGRIKARFDRLFGNPKMPPGAYPADTIPGVTPGGGSGTRQYTEERIHTGPEGEHREVVHGAETEPSETSHETPPLNVSSSPPEAHPEEEIPLPAGWTKEETEEYLGQAAQAQRDAARVAA